MPQARRGNTYEYLRDAFGERAANVLLGAYCLFIPIAGGVWDTAFAEVGDPPVGFDFAGSPFGEDAFDLFPFLPAAKGTLKYRDVFTGFVYAQPLGEQYLQQGVPGYYQGFEEEILRRGRLLGEHVVGLYKSDIKRERAGLVGLKSELAVHVHGVETRLEVCLAALNGIGVLIGVVSFGVGLWRYRYYNQNNNRPVEPMRLRSET